MLKFLSSVVMVGIVSVSSIAYSASIVTSKSFPQKISVCLNVDKNTSPINFEASFYSTDIFDRGQSITFHNGNKCIEHQYQFGPKNITLQVGMGLFGVRTQINTDASCNFMKHTAPAYFRADRIRPSNHVERWTFNITEIKPQNDRFEFEFMMSCEHQSL